MVGLLESPAADVVALAKQVINAVHDARREREFWGIAVATSGGHLRAFYGNQDWVTKDQAEKALEKGTLPILEGEGYAIVRVYSLAHVDSVIADVDGPVQLTLRNKDRGIHPVPYASHDDKSRRRYQRMSKREKYEEYDRRMPA